MSGSHWCIIILTTIECSPKLYCRIMVKPTLCLAAIAMMLNNFYNFYYFITLLLNINPHWCLAARRVEDPVPLLRSQFSLWLIKKLKSIQTKKLKKFCSCQIKQRVSGVKESNHLMYKMSVHLVALKVLFFANSFVCLFVLALIERT